MRVTSTMKVMPPPGQTQTGAPPLVTRVSASLTERVSRTGLRVTPARSEPPAPAMNSTEHSAGSQFSRISATVSGEIGRHRRRHRPQRLVEHEVGGVLAGGADHQHASGPAAPASG